MENYLAEYKKSRTFAHGKRLEGFRHEECRDSFSFRPQKKEILITTKPYRKFIMAYMSQEGYDKLRAQIKQLEEVDRPEVIRQIAEAREKGDLSENAEYDAAKEAQGKLETKIAELKAILADTKILDPSKLTKTDEVQILSKVELKNVENGMKLVYTIVSEGEANLRENKISIKTPIAQGLLGKKVGDVAEVTVPRGVMKFEIMNITFG